MNEIMIGNVMKVILLMAGVGTGLLLFKVRRIMKSQDEEAQEK